MKLLRGVVILVMLLTLMLNASLYEDAEDGTTKGWQVVDNLPEGAKVVNIKEGSNHVIKLIGEQTKNAFMLGGTNRDISRWNNRSNSKELSWKMKFASGYSIYVYIQTKSGDVQRIRYDAMDSSKGLSHTEIHIGLGRTSRSGQWVLIHRDLEKDLQRFLPKEEIVALNGFMVRGEGFIDDILYADTVEVASSEERNDVPDQRQETIENEESDLISTEWRKYPNEEIGNAMVVDGAKIEFKESGKYILGGSPDESIYRWNNKHTTFSWRMKFDARYYLYFLVTTKQGKVERIRYSSSHDYERKPNEIRIPLGKETADGEWKSITVDLNKDLQKFLSDDQILTVDGLLVHVTENNQLMENFSEGLSLVEDNSMEEEASENLADIDLDSKEIEIKEVGNDESEIKEVTTEENSESSLESSSIYIGNVKSKATYYVSLDGDDSNDGRSIKNAFRTIKKAVDIVDEGETVSILAGVYREGNIKLPRRRYPNKKYITFQNYNNDKVILKGSVVIDGEWEHYKGDIWRLPAQGADHSGLNRSINYQQVFYGNGKQLLKIGYPNTLQRDGKSIWDARYLPLKENHKNPFGMSEGTFYVKPLSGGKFDLYVWLPHGKSPNASDVTMEVSDKTYLLNVANVDNVKVSGLIFMHTSAESSAERSNAYQGGYGLRVGINAIVENCEFAYTDFVGLNLSRGRVRDAKTQHQIVHNCKVHHNGAVGISASSKGFLIEDSEFYNNGTRPFDQDWHAGAFKCNNNGWGEVRNNYIHDEFSQGIWFDSSYSKTNAKEHQSFIHHNYINGTGIDNDPLGLRTLPYRGMGIFIERSSHAKIYNNIVANSRQNGLYVDASWDIVATNNFFIGSLTEQIRFKLKSHEYHAITDNIIQNNIIYNKRGEQDVKIVMNGNSTFDRSNTFKNNIIFNDNGDYQYDFKQSGWHERDNLEDADPNFDKHGSSSYNKWGLRRGSVAINASIGKDFFTTDYYNRLRDSKHDIGSFEYIP